VRSIADDLLDAPDGTYDLYVGKYWRSTPVVRDASGAVVEGAWDKYPLDTVHSGIQIDNVYLWSGGIMYLDLPREEAYRYARALRDAKGSGILVPTRYREPRISPAEGLTLATNEFSRIHDPDAEYGQASIANEYCCWCYTFPDLTAQAQGIIPGALFIFIHKMTGRVCTNKEVLAWAYAHSVG
jgi:hypothetical protein